MKKNRLTLDYSSNRTGGVKIVITVKKRDGRKEPFIAEKIIVSAIKSGASPEYARTMASRIEQNATDGISTRDLKNQVLVMLKAKNPEWEKNWMVFDTAVKKRSE
jgi:transcriptional regulator NrdR family protein